MADQNYSVAVVGLGSMGMGTALSCVRAGLTTYGIDLNPVALDKLKQAGAEEVAANGDNFAQDLDAVVILVVNAQQTKSVLFSEKGLAQKLKKGTAVMVSSTMAAADAIEISKKLTKMGLIMLDAPVSGGAAKAAAGEMTVMASGSVEAFEKLQPVLDATAGKVYNIGTEIGLGSTVKIIHQLLAGVHIAAGAEAMALASKAGIPLDVMYDVVTNAAGNSWMFENRMKHIVDGDYTPFSMVDIFVKDLGLVNDTAKSLKFPLHLASTAYSMFTEASNAGFGKEDDSAVIKIFSGINLPKKGDN
ncbi:NAD(P)-dependent oxidoreductase [Haemophilus influenzae]|uniref:L-threonate dehydrogenase n=1 Tax=Haemophilus influenzae TaxID=727 RepID=A0A2S9S2G7_HAEIF|nr:L-threonate dehydrogenase [Haemophilus influenzae]MCK8795505.1 NAD(P)-dependent oxidoreductase [Haemophilus influenzae]MCK8830544.1 NAD(P)-dependent oxidoreductase [Haemophilus influenzae]MCK8841373.1 NAD(P)-dependent oxidoreductase [Haemophilus influenzae]MCK9059089.1 NAD(P)-dependent oxidoreductase [Haemophilus influenzae]PRK66473.1 2-(hydroxymethyl)glutarate dehydrogenase [Haemophilus influenzae]